MKKAQQITLPKDPVKALETIADYLDANLKGGTIYPPNGDERASEGKVKSWDFFYDLQAIAHCSREISQSSAS